MPPDIASVSVLDLRAGDNRWQRYILVGLRDGDLVPKDGYRLLIVFAGGMERFVWRVASGHVPE